MRVSSRIIRQLRAWISESPTGAMLLADQCAVFNCKSGLAPSPDLLAYNASNSSAAVVQKADRAYWTTLAKGRQVALNAGGKGVCVRPREFGTARLRRGW